MTETMNNPAIEAAQRACEAQGDDLVDNDVAVDTAIAAAREALAPLRELHRKVPQYLDCDYSTDREHDICPDGFESADGEWCCPTCTEADGGPSWVCANCLDEAGDPLIWHCATAELVYSSEEL